MSNQIPVKLKSIYDKFDNCPRCKKEKNNLNHILGGGKFKNPKFLFLFINPTYHNISSHKNYSGNRRYPFIGVRYFWKLFTEVGFINKDIIDDIYGNGWQIEHENKIENNLVKSEIYISNLVKCTQPHPVNPTRNVIEQDSPLLKEEIKIVNPKYIIAFGKLTVKIITGLDVRLSDYLNDIETGEYKALKSINILDKRYKVLPCFFPVGRGNSSKALKTLKYIKANY